MADTNPPPIVALHPEYQLIVRWRADAEGNGVRCFLQYCPSNDETQHLMTSFHGTLDILDAVESALTEFFEKS